MVPLLLSPSMQHRQQGYVAEEAACCMAGSMQREKEEGARDSVSPSRVPLPPMIRPHLLKDPSSQTV